ncbi:MAG: hypothetical protein JOZ12_00205 [Sinobacteraceae bacterium]|nr:hypothetical protein [Nevskiaceae bacterium]
MYNKGFGSRRSSLPKLTALFLSALPLCAQAATWYATNDGSDGATCGHSRDHACRSISQAMQNAADGDVIWVGAGRYGDLNGNGSFTDPGDEHALDYGNGTSCVLCITKALSLYSYNGTAATIIEGNSNFNATVQVLSDRVVFGSRDHGFTVTGGPVGVEINYDTVGFPQGGGNGTSLQHGISVVGNIAIKTPVGFEVDGEPYKVSPGCPPEAPCAPTGRVLLSGNTTVGGDTGFLVNNMSNHFSEIAVQNNQASGATTGFGTFADFTGVEGNVVLGSSAEHVHLLHNEASAGGVGFAAAFVGSLQNNVASGNSVAGFIVVPGGLPPTIFTGNVATGNGGPGVVVSFDDPANMQAGFKSFAGNDFYGNDRRRPASMTIGYPADPTDAYKPGPGAHCGVLNIGALAAVPPLSSPLPALTLLASDNYWGSSSGPKPNGAGDAAGGPCDQNSGVTVSKPFSTSWFSFVPLPQ